MLQREGRIRFGKAREDKNQSTIFYTRDVFIWNTGFSRLLNKVKELRDMLFGLT